MKRKQRGRGPAKITQICYSNQYPQENLNLVHHLLIFLWTLTSDAIQGGDRDRKTAGFQTSSCSTEIPGAPAAIRNTHQPKPGPQASEEDTKLIETCPQLEQRYLH